MRPIHPYKKQIKKSKEAQSLIKLMLNNKIKKEIGVKKRKEKLCQLRLTFHVYDPGHEIGFTA